MKINENLRMNRKSTALLTLLALFFLSIGTARAQTEAPLTLRLSKDFGAAMGGKIQGTFSMIASGPENLNRVVFMIDGQSVGEVSQAPFRLRFQTDSYSLGSHTLSATGYTADGQELPSNTITTEFVTAEEGWKAGLKIAGPILIILVVVMLLSFIFTIPAQRKLKSMPLGTPRNYGMSGGTICPRCERPFPVHAFSPNIGFGHKLERCPFCGRTGSFRVVGIDALRRAEAAELEKVDGGPKVEAMSEEEKLRKEIESSRYQDM